MSLEKIINVYRGVCHVLVLDSSLDRCKSEELSEVEILGRIFTSNWMRRLWTLQGKMWSSCLVKKLISVLFSEGALAKSLSLCFQFADRAVSLPETLSRLSQITTRDSRYWDLCQDFTLEWIRLDYFFNTDPGREGKYLLMCLNEALQYRSVSIMSDEPLCISTLLGLEIPQVLQHSNRDDRVERLRTLMCEKFGGIPAGVAFFGDDTLSSPGWR